MRSVCIALKKALHEVGMEGWGGLEDNFAPAWFDEDGDSSDRSGTRARRLIEKGGVYFRLTACLKVQVEYSRFIINVCHHECGNDRRLMRFCALDVFHIETYHVLTESIVYIRDLKQSTYCRDLRGDDEIKEMHFCREENSTSKALLTMRCQISNGVVNKLWQWSTGTRVGLPIDIEYLWLINKTSSCTELPKPDEQMSSGLQNCDVAFEPDCRSSVITHGKHCRGEVGSIYQTARL